MRSLITAFMCVACSASRPPVQQEQAPIPEALPDDPELSAACLPDWQQPPPAACRVDEATKKTIMKNDDPSFGMVAEILDLEKGGESLSVGRTIAIVNLATLVIDNPKASECSRQVSRWHRAMALHELGRWREAFLDFGAVIKTGPNSPFYTYVGAWIDSLAPHFSHQTYSVCASAYDNAIKEPKK
jgi:hypothetical protein